MIIGLSVTAVACAAVVTPLTIIHNNKNKLTDESSIVTATSVAQLQADALTKISKKIY